MQDERATEERQAAIRAAIQILSDARRPIPTQAVAPLPGLSEPRRIRIGDTTFDLDKLALLVLLIIVGMYAIMALAYLRTQSLVDNQERALALLTAPDVSAVRLEPEGGFAADAQATYWSKSGADVAVLTLSDVRPVAGGTRYRWWAQHGDHRTILAGGTLHGQDNIHLVATSPDLTTPPDAIWVTLEAADADPSLVQATVLSWSNR